MGGTRLRRPGATGLTPPAWGKRLASLPIAPVVPGTLMGGSTGGSVTDSNLDAVFGTIGLSTATPDAFYVGLIDGIPAVPAAELHADSFSVSFLFAGHTQNIPSANFCLSLTCRSAARALPAEPTFFSVGRRAIIARCL